AEQIAAELRRENRQLSLYTSSMVSMVEGTVPKLKSQKEELRRVLHSLNRQRARSERDALTMQQLRRELDETKAAAGELQKENASLKESREDIGAQLQMLLWRQVEAGRDGGSGVMSLSTAGNVMVTAPGRRGGGSAGGDVIRQHLVTFDDVAGLQRKNEQLLTTVRKLTDERIAWGAEAESARRAAVAN
ncbi:unnamed protein product, partial [Phaeothamnion confervicola]